jgi:phage terminase small subunit
MPNASDKPLSERERRFVDAYMGEAAGNGTKAAILAGYGKAGAHVTASRFLRNPKIAAAIAKAAASDPKVLTRVERQQLWSAWTQDPNVPWPARVKASELLGKSQADFIERVEHSGTIAVDDIRASLAQKLAAVAQPGPA